MPTGWRLGTADRVRLLALRPPRYPNVDADHVTLTAGHGHDAELPEEAVGARVVGHVDDGLGVEALVVEIGGVTQRPDSGTWHITWSLADGRKARESNDVIGRQGWEPWDGGPIALTPATW
ncbi:hypothetical protein ACFO0A_11935 [Novosphingobium tardum]|uniref:Uncharacterized protein n=1 Tax=Novosphingobium tardum TaxID=1538021 RepID=A0ABV8RSW5_9SPHN